MHCTWNQILTLAATNIGMILACLGVFITLYVNLQNSTQKSIATMQYLAQEQMNGIREEIRELQLERKDFHGRLISLEERRKKGD